MKSIERGALIESRVFDELAEKISKLRAGEPAAPLAGDETGRAAVEQLMAEVDAFAPGRVDGERLEAFRGAWNDFVDLRDRGLREPGGRDAMERSVHRAYVKVEAALDLLAGDSRNHIARAAAAADSFSQSARTLLAAAAAMATIAALALFLHVRKTLFAPLRDITAALTALAQGRADVEPAERAACDEIAGLASAFRVFRAKLAELEQAHQAVKIARKAAESLALSDSLTDLPNRRMLSAKLAAYFEGEQESACALLIVDLDRFDLVNDLLGHMVGDLVLCAAARRLEDVVERLGLAARLGGAEFAVVLPLPGGDILPARTLAGTVLARLRAPIVVGEHRVEIGASIGIAVSTGAADPATLMSAADIARRRAKNSGCEPICLFEPEMEGELRRSAGLEKALRRALAAGEITPHYQPIVELGTGRLHGFEILARWRDLDLGQVSPEIFIPLAEQRGLIADLCMAELGRACGDAALWRDDIVLSINISALQLRDASFPDDLLASLRAYGFAPQRLELEITETALIGDVALVRDIFVRLRAAGVRISLDDFGMGFSSLNHLRQFRIDKVKIDKAFTKTIFEDPESALIVRSVIQLARGLRLMVVAEGIEDARTADMMKAMGCDFGQGYHFGKALSAADAAALAGADAGPREQAA